MEQEFEAVNLMAQFSNAINIIPFLGNYSYAKHLVAGLNSRWRQMWMDNELAIIPVVSKHGIEIKLTENDLDNEAYL